MKKIAIFGGTFNPIHKGHINVAKYVIKKLNLDKLFFVPNFISPFKKNQTNNAFHRYKMIEMILEDKMKISDFEIKRKGISYTFETIKYFQNKFKDSQIFFIIGSDHLKKLYKWKNIDFIIKNSQFLVFKRAKKINKLLLKKYNCKLLDIKSQKFSSSYFKEGNFDLLNHKTLNYISENLLYLEEIIKNNLDGSTWIHSQNVAKLASKYARINNYDFKKAYFTGLMHDFTKNWKITKHHSFLKEINYQNIDQLQNYQLHSLTSSLWFEKKYFLKDQEILKAIKNHTSLDLNLSLLDKIIFMADKLCIGRRWKGIQKIRELSLINFDRAFKETIIAHEKNIIFKNGFIDEKQKRINSKWKK